MSMPSIALLTNPESGSGDADEVAGRLRALGAGLSVYALGEVEAALAQGPDRIAVAGGDGSLACVAAPAGRAGVPVAVIPTGTANDFARALGLPRDPAAASELAVLGTRTRPLDLAWMDERPFLNVASLGLPPAAAKHASGLKAMLGSFAYGIGALRAGLRAKPVSCVVHSDGEELFAGAAWQVTVACSGAFGAGSSIGADEADGRLDAVILEAGSRARLALHAYGMRGGDLATQSGVRKVRCSAAEVELARPALFNVDGELVESGSCAFRVERHAVSVVVP